MKKGKIPLLIILFGIACAISFFTAPGVYLFISKQTDKFKACPPQACFEILKAEKDARMLFICIAGFALILCYFLLFSNTKDDYRAELYSVTPDIQIPKPVGQYQHGSAWFLSADKFCEDYPIVKINLKAPVFRYLLQHGKQDINEVKKYRISNGELRQRKLFQKLPHRKVYICLLNKYTHSELYLKRQAKMLKRLDTEPLKNTGGGLVVSYRKKWHTELLNVLINDVHSMCIGSTGSGKSRYLVIQSIICQLLAGESVFVSDIKGELYQYLCRLLERLGVNAIVLDYRDMSKSMSYNFLQPVIDKLKSGDVNKAMQLCRDYATMIAGKKSEQTESLWHDGKVAVLAAGMMACTYDNMDHPENQNLCYVYEWLTRMCAERPGGKGLLLNEYLKAVGEEHPANLIFAQAKVAPSKTRGSFYTSACTALTVFTDRQLYHICSKSDFKLTDLATKKTAMFVILPESKTTFYPLVSLLVSQIYEALDDYSNNVLGSGRLPRRVHFDLDEFGNFSPFPDFNMKLTVARSKGIIFNLFLQSFAQMKENYNDNICEIIKGNCTNQIYLKSTDDSGTNKAISDSLGKYTTSSYSLSSNSGKYNSSGSTSMNLSERNLLYPDELKRLKRPYMLVIGDSGCKITKSPDLSKWAFNKMLGLGNRKHNEKVRALRQAQRPKLQDVDKPPSYTGMWKLKNFTDFLKKQKRL
ncbi:VirD4-like conjugal transfer protein, CD1115 family [Ruminococcus sp. Marseille-P6503]|uniref:VirD4-like conjugal transfer protein, CD1115 family n=1 Tax=Ruminococcus sp. Marseille-P6503 TaxID=2364796 RepID=UPI000F53DCEC|nr:type IV secretory system conjugative DNA transfer family protein [Ruminococcus sp. Marseille-P6503]